MPRMYHLSQIAYLLAFVVTLPGGCAMVHGIRPDRHRDDKAAKRF